MAYQSLYRKYRPQTFADVVGQGHVTRTLQNALASGRVAHGYLFTGTRGTAKTTVARLLAKALNCQSFPGPTPEPCNRCDACLRITAGSCIDVIEMDAASHRGVADIEEVRKSVGYGPMEMRYKVFIIDEAHQLSSDAKDAFLKTLEEPPDNVVFVLATTEPQAIPITIRSRCQQFDFKRGSLAEIASRLRYVLDCEGVTYAPEAVNLVARGAEGSYRDSLSLLEQVLAFSPQHISAADVDTVLGTLDAEALAQVTQAVARKDAPTALALAGQLLDSGKEARTLLKTLAGHFRDLLLVTVGGPAAGQELTPEEVQRLQQEQQVCRFPAATLLRAMDVLNEAQGETRWNNQHRLLVELTFLKLMTLDAAPPTAANAAAASAAAPAVPFATAPIVFPERREAPAASSAPPIPPPTSWVPPSLISEGGVTATESGAASHEAEAEPATAPRPPFPGKGAAEAEPPEELPAGFFADDLADAGDDAIEEEEFGPDDQTPSIFDDLPELPIAASAAPAVSVSALAASAGVPEAEDDLFPVEIEDSFAPTDETDEADEEDDLFAPAASVSAEPAAMPPAPPEPVATEELRAVLGEEEAENHDGIHLEIGQVMRAWPRFLQEAQKISKQTEVMMAKAVPTEANGKTVTVAFSARMNYERMNEPKKLEFVRKLLARCLDVESVAVRFVLDENVPPPPARTRGAEKKAVKRDPIAALAELDAIAVPPPSPADDLGVWGGGFTVSAPPAAALPPPAPKRVHEEPVRPTIADVAAPHAADALLPPARNGHRPGTNGTGAAGDTGATAARREVALENPLVQETLQVFGGEIVEE